uniref:Neuropeptide n=1 Tax=Aplysia californica TaxID=6500 RepID=Q8MMK6_APLCA|nr:pleurin precursor [Aplysia californica]AAK56547.1 neuropeptide precursor [Aplysia californica]
MQSHVSSSLLALCILTGSACAMFYTKGSDSDYPRIGRRSFYTTGNGNHYPRIGRRDSPGAAAGTDILYPSAASGFSDFPASASAAKRGIFTQSAYGSYPRVGRRSQAGDDGSQEGLQTARSKIFQKITGLDGPVEEELGDGSAERLEADNQIGLELMFLAFDLDGDQALSKSEFKSGMEKFRRHNPLC